MSIKQKKVETGLALTWRPKNAWFFLGLTLLVANLINVVLYNVERQHPAFYSFRREPAGLTLAYLLGFVVILGVALYCAKPRTLADFVAAMDLTRPRTRSILLAFAAGFLIQLAGRMIAGWGSFSQFRITRSVGPVDIVILSAPFFEEPALRGFAYRAFRNTLPITLSISFVVVIHLILHWGQIRHSVTSCVTATAVTITLCILKERHSKLWYCIACHFAFNAAYIFIRH